MSDYRDVQSLFEIINHEFLSPIDQALEDFFLDWSRQAYSMWLTDQRVVTGYQNLAEDLFASETIASCMAYYLTDLIANERIRILRRKKVNSRHLSETRFKALVKTLENGCFSPFAIEQLTEEFDWMMSVSSAAPDWGKDTVFISSFYETHTLAKGKLRTAKTVYLWHHSRIRFVLEACGFSPSATDVSELIRCLESKPQDEDGYEYDPITSVLSENSGYHPSAKDLMESNFPLSICVDVFRKEGAELAGDLLEKGDHRTPSYRELENLVITHDGSVPERRPDKNPPLSACARHFIRHFRPREFLAKFVRSLE